MSPHKGCFRADCPGKTQLRKHLKGKNLAAQMWGQKLNGKDKTLGFVQLWWDPEGPNDKPSHE